MARQHRIQSIARRAWRVLRTQGLCGVWIKLLDVSLHRRLLVLECPVDDARSFQRAGLDGSVIHGFLTRAGIDDYVAFRLSEEDDLNPVASSAPNSLREHLERRLEAGCVCATALIDGRIAAGMWAVVGGGEVDYLRCSVRLDPQAVYLHDLYTRPSQRGLGLAPGLIAGMAEHFQAAGCRRLVALVLPENEASLRSLGRVGFRCVGRAGYWGFGRLRWLFCTAPGCSLVSLP
jgi:ribosomal protein S18 acetylase RimI-like enzyme